MVIEVKPLQPKKQPSPNEVTEEGMVMEVKALQPEKQKLPNEETEEGIEIEVKLLQPLKQEFPNEETEQERYAGRRGEFSSPACFAIGAVRLGRGEYYVST